MKILSGRCGFMLFVALAIFLVSANSTASAGDGMVELEFESKPPKAGTGGDDEGLEYTLQFRFPFRGREIVKIHVNTNGLIELLESGESCVECDDYATYEDGDHVTYDIDAIFANNDDLLTGFVIDGRRGWTKVTWIGSNYDDYSLDYPLEFQVTLFGSGHILWEFFDQDCSGTSGPFMFSGIYDEVADIELEVAGGSPQCDGTEVNRRMMFEPDQLP